LIREVSRAALVVAGLSSLEEYENYPVGLHWQELLPIDDLAAAQTAMLYQQLGVSTDTVLAKLGFDPDDEVRKSALEAAQKRAQQQPTQQPMMAGQLSPIASTPAGE
jgi:uncharacterized membrane protein YdfJ with MMPL/SSD domain